MTIVRKQSVHVVSVANVVGSVSWLIWVFAALCTKTVVTSAIVVVFDASACVARSTTSTIWTVPGSAEATVVVMRVVGKGVITVTSSVVGDAERSGARPNGVAATG